MKLQCRSQTSANYLEVLCGLWTPGAIMDYVYLLKYFWLQWDAHDDTPHPVKLERTNELNKTQGILIVGHVFENWNIYAMESKHAK